MRPLLVLGVCSLTAACGSAAPTGTPEGDGGTAPDSPTQDGPAVGSEGGADSAHSPDGGSDAPGTHDGPPNEGGGMTGLHVNGNKLVDGNGNPVRLLGVNRSGSEYACIMSFGFFDGPTDQASIDAIKSWTANAVRVPLNEDCWLGINGAPAQYSGMAYQQAIVGFVDLLLSNGIYPIVELHWNAPGTTMATGQLPMPDADHAVDLWTQVATTFKAKPSVLLELYNEPYPDNNQDTTAAWTCWRDGGNCPSVPFPVAGMQTLVTAVRNAGAPNVVLLGGVQYSNALSQWLTYKPSDPMNNLAAAWHIYNFNSCSSTSCYDMTAGPVAQSVPIVATEIGENDCGGGFITPLMGWLDMHQQNYLAWVWDTWGTACTSIALVSDYMGTPNGTYGMTYKSHITGVPH
jgi:endoglucanase